MPRPPTKHGLEKKFKTWRKGKSNKSKSSSCLKKQLRGHERLLGKLLSSKNNDDTKRCEELKLKIEDMKNQIGNKKTVEKERNNASKSHGIRFLERQRLVRMERTLLRHNKDDKNLKKIALDQVYVAHFPHNVKYTPLFKKGTRMVDDWKTLRRRAITRHRILQSISKDDEEKVQWISKKQYNCIPTTWTIEKEEEMFGKKQEDRKRKRSDLPQDDRFQVSLNHQKILEAGKKFQKELDKEEEDGKSDDNESVSSSFSHDSNDDKIDKLMSFKKISPDRTSIRKESVSDSSSSQDNDSDDSDSDDSSSSSGDDSSSDDDSSHSSSPKTATTTSKGVMDDFDDDFFLPATDNTYDAFQKAQDEKLSFATGDKSTGWATQKQRPGQWKKRRQRH